MWNWNVKEPFFLNQIYAWGFFQELVLKAIYNRKFYADTHLSRSDAQQLKLELLTL